MKHKFLWRGFAIDSSEERLLTEKETPEKESPANVTEDHDPKRRLWIPLLHIVAFFVYSSVYIVAVQNGNSRESLYVRVDSPATDALKPELRSFNYDYDITKKYFSIIPTEARDARWKEILDVSTFKFSAEAMERWGRLGGGVLLADGSGYMGTLNVYHELHCIERLYMWMFRDHYFPNVSETEEKLFMEHNMHCLDSLRQSSQCRIDVSPVTYQWGTRQKIPLANFSSPHECRNWGVFKSWSEQNSFNPKQPGLVVHPKFGPAYTGEFDPELRSGLVIDKLLVDS